MNTVPLILRWKIGAVNNLLVTLIFCAEVGFRLSQRDRRILVTFGVNYRLLLDSVFSRAETGKRLFRLERFVERR